MVGFLPTVDELRLHTHRLAGDQVLDLAHLVVSLIATHYLFKYRPQLAALPGVEVALQLRLTDCGRVLAVQHTQCICEQQAFA
ncbi:hypothetical protein D3C73_1365190 [compost metagenome]